MLPCDRRLIRQARGPALVRGGPWFAATLICLLTLGCGGPSNDVGQQGKAGTTQSGASKSSAATGAAADKAAAERAAAETVDSVLDRMLKAYREAKSYSDNGKIVLRVQDSRGDQSQEFDVHVMLQRPNLLRIEHQPALPNQRPLNFLVVADGSQIFARPEGYDNQVVVIDDPAKIEVPALYDVDALRMPNDGMSLLPSGLTGQSLVLDLLASQKPMEELDRSQAKLLAPADIDGRSYQRVEFTTPDGLVTFWINQETSVVRRVQFPTASLRKDLLGDDNGELTLSAELVDAALNPTLPPDRFTFPKNEAEHYVKQLIEMPNPADAPAKLLGQQMPDIEFLNSQGVKQTAKDLKGKVTVIDFWATWCGWCKKGMPGVDEVRKKYAGNDKVQFLALSLDDPQVPNDQIVSVLKEINVNPTWARTTLKDTTELYQQFGFEGIPAMVILDAKGRIQFQHVGMDQNVQDNLPPVIDALLAGTDLAAKAIEAWDTRMREYHRLLSEASVGAGTTIEIPRAKVADRSAPQKFTLTPLWTAKDVKEPGNLLVIEGTGKAAPRILVIDQWHQIVELDPEGKQVARHAELVPKEPPFSFLRTFVGHDGKRLFIAGAVGQEQFHVFDDQWHRTLSYPPEGTAKIFDVLPVDLDGDGRLELCVGYFGPAGVHAVMLDGKRLWRNRTIENVTSMAATAPDKAGKREVLCTCTSEKGALVPISSDGTAGRPIVDPDHAITYIKAADLDGDGTDEYCALVEDGKGHRSVAGLALKNGTGEVLWHQAIPAGEHEHSIEPITTIQLSAQGPKDWLVAAADGSVHFIADDGSWQDEFNSGGPLTGLAAFTIDDKTVLLLAHPDKLVALSVAKKP